MRRSRIGVWLGTLLVLGLTAGQCLSEGNGPLGGIGQTPSASGSQSSAATYQPSQSSQPSSNLITHVLPGEGGAQLIVAVDPVQRVLAVYHVDKSTGVITLRSVRNITWDLQMVEFNSGDPKPQDIRNVRGELQR